MDVSCLKLEGRMKRPEYVAVITDIYARLIRESRKPTAAEKKDLELAFSRSGFTVDYWQGRHGPAMFGTRPENTPEPKAKDPIKTPEPKTASVSSVLNKKTVTTIADTAIPLFSRIAEEAEQRAIESLKLVGLPEEFHGQNPFDLSGGQMRRVAIAGILAMQPDILVLDEPTAGLDPQGRKELMSLFKELHLSGMTIVLVTHLMDDVADYATAVNVMEKGQLVFSGAPKDVFQKVTFLKEKQLGVPKITEFALQLQEKGYQFESLPITIEEFVEVVSHG